MNHAGLKLIFCFRQKEEPGPGPDQVTVHFPETVPMSTYLVCFIVSDFKDSGVAMVDNMGKSLPVRIYSTPGQVQNTLFSKSAAAAVAKYYIDYFDIPYALPKLGKKRISHTRKVTRL